jgi:hypothetical protein
MEILLFAIKLLSCMNICLPHAMKDLLLQANNYLKPVDNPKISQCTDWTQLHIQEYSSSVPAWRLANIYFCHFPHSFHIIIHSHPTIWGNWEIIVKRRENPVDSIRAPNQWNMILSVKFLYAFLAIYPV